MVTLGREMRQKQVQLYLHFQSRCSCEGGRYDRYLVALLKLLQMLMVCFIGLIYSKEVSLLCL